MLVGGTDRESGEPIECAAADHVVDSLHALPTVMPELFAPGAAAAVPVGERAPPERRESLAARWSRRMSL